MLKQVSESESEEPFWEDSDDDRLTISLASNSRLRKLRESATDDVISGREYIRRLRLQYERLHPRPEWAKQPPRKKRRTSQESEEESVTQPLDDLLRSGGPLIRTATSAKNRTLRPEVVDIQRTSDFAKGGPSSIDVLEFHHELPLLLAAGPSSTITLYHVSPNPPNSNPILTSLHLKGTPVRSAAFGKANQVFVSSRRRYFHNWALSSGIVTKVSRPVYGTVKQQQKTMELFKLSPDENYMGLVGSTRKGGGCVNVISTETMQWICQCQIESRGGVADFAWHQNSQGFVVVGKNGEVAEFDVRQRRILARWHDEGAVGTTVVAIGGEAQCLGRSRWVAIGSSSGVVNLYDRIDWKHDAPSRPIPARVFDQITTPISFLLFSQDAQMLVIGSRWKKNALRLVHLPTCTIFRNWPTDKTPLGRISSAALSPGGNYLAIANEQGKIRLWEIRD